MSFHRPRLICGLILVASAASASHAQGIPTFDAANLAQALQQVQAWGQQYQQMADQLQAQQQQLQGMSGNRGFGTVANSVGVTSVVPNDAAAQLGQQSTASELISKAKALNSGSLTATEQRGNQIQQLMGQISATTDAKGAAEIQARISAEGAAVTNDANRIALMNMQQRVEADRVNNAIKAKHDAIVTSPNRVDADFKSLFIMGVQP